MAQVATPTNLGNGTVNFSTTATTGTLTVTSGSLLIAIVTSRVGGSQADLSSVSSSFSMSTAWSEYVENDYTTSPTYFPKVAVWWGIASGTSGTVTATWAGGGVERGRVDVIQITADYDSSTPFAQNAVADLASDASPQATLGSAPQANSICIFAHGGRFATAGTNTPDTNWTTLAFATDSSLITQICYADGSNGQTGGFTYSGTISEAAVINFEVQEVQSAGGSPSPIFETIFRAVNS